MSDLYLGSIRIKNHAFFDDVEIELKPLTIFVGRNASGKSILLNLVWLLLSLEPDFEKWIETLGEVGAPEIMDAIIDKARRGDDIEEEFRELVKLALKTLLGSLEVSFNRGFKNTFGLDPKIFCGEAGLSIEIRGAYSDRYTVKVYYDEVSGEFKIEYIEPQVFLDLANRTKVKLAYQTAMKTAEGLQKSYIYDIVLGSQLVEKSEMSSYENVMATLVGTVGSVFHSIVYPWFTAERNTAFSVDGRAGFIRAIMRPWVKTDELKLLYPDRVFIRKYFYLAELLYDGKIDLDIVRNVLSEVGIRDILARVERGYVTIYVKLWNDVEVPLDIAPSGIRELATPLLALAAKDVPIVVIEEPEAHLHPAAILALGKAIARAINKMHKLALISTHSDNMLIRLSHLIEASKLSDEKRKELGLEDFLLPNMVAVYLFKCDKNRKRTVIKRAEVSDEGINEEEMSEILMELANEGSLIRLTKG